MTISGGCLFIAHTRISFSVHFGNYSYVKLSELLEENLSFYCRQLSHRQQTMILASAFCSLTMHLKTQRTNNNQDCTQPYHNKLSPDSLLVIDNPMATMPLEVLCPLSALRPPRSHLRLHLLQRLSKSMAVLPPLPTMRNHPSAGRASAWNYWGPFQLGLPPSPLTPRSGSRAAASSSPLVMTTAWHLLNAGRALVDRLWGMMEDGAHGRMGQDEEEPNLIFVLNICFPSFVVALRRRQNWRQAKEAAMMEA